jgi:hypothetical protein
MAEPLKVVYWPDTHVPYHSEQAVETALKIVHWFKPDIVNILGDFLDYDPCSRHIRESVVHKASVDMAKEFDEGNKLFDRLTKHCQNVVYHEGNHENRAYTYIDQNPAVRGLVEVDKGLQFKERRKAGYKIKHLQYNECHRIGNLYSTHGLYTTQNHAAKHVSSFGRNLIYGHIHDFQQSTAVSPIDVSIKHVATSLGCLCDRNPSYMRNAPNKWVHCVGLCYFREDGTFNLYPVIISDGVASFAGKIFAS